VLSLAEAGREKHRVDDVEHRRAHLNVAAGPAPWERHRQRDVGRVAGPLHGAPLLADGDLARIWAGRRVVGLVGLHGFRNNVEHQHRGDVDAVAKDVIRHAVKGSTREGCIHGREGRHLDCGFQEELGIEQRARNPRRLVHHVHQDAQFRHCRCLPRDGRGAFPCFM